MISVAPATAQPGQRIAEQDRDRRADAEARAAEQRAEPQHRQARGQGAQRQSCGHSPEVDRRQTGQCQRQRRRRQSGAARIVGWQWSKVDGVQ
jgi:hypothetical protein